MAHYRDVLDVEYDLKVLEAVIFDYRAESKIYDEVKLLLDAIKVDEDVLSQLPIHTRGPKKSTAERLLC